MNNNKSPGNDGYTVECSKKFLEKFNINYHKCNQLYVYKVGSCLSEIRNNLMHTNGQQTKTVFKQTEDTLHSWMF